MKLLITTNPRIELLPIQQSWHSWVFVLLFRMQIFFAVASITFVPLACILAIRGHLVAIVFSMEAVLVAISFLIGGLIVKLLAHRSRIMLSRIREIREILLEEIEHLASTRAAPEVITRATQLLRELDQIEDDLSAWFVSREWSKLKFFNWLQSLTLERYATA